MKDERNNFLIIENMIERLNNSIISVDEFKNYYVLISNALINKDISEKQYVGYLNILKNASINHNTTEDRKKLYKQVLEVINDKITEQGIKIVKENYRKIKEMNFEITHNVTAELFIKLCNDFDYSEVMKIEGIDYVEWAKKLEGLNPICENPLEIQKVSEYKIALSNYLLKKTK